VSTYAIFGCNNGPIEFWAVMDSFFAAGILFRFRQLVVMKCTCQLTILGAKSLDLSYQVDDFKHRCLGWDKYDDNLNALNIIHTRK
jgi:hypothetical protein